MEAIILELVSSTIRSSPGYFVAVIGFITLVFAMYLKVRSVNISEVTSISKLQSDQVSDLLKGMSQLSLDLVEARKEISALYDKIDELENVVRMYRAKLKDLPEESS